MPGVKHVGWVSETEAALFLMSRRPLELQKELECKFIARNESTFSFTNKSAHVDVDRGFVVYGDDRTAKSAAMGCPGDFVAKSISGKLYVIPSSLTTNLKAVARAIIRSMPCDIVKN
jgi:hypothetical protein